MHWAENRKRARSCPCRTPAGCGFRGSVRIRSMSRRARQEPRIQYLTPKPRFQYLTPFLEAAVGFFEAVAEDTSDVQEEFGGQARVADAQAAQEVFVDDEHLDVGCGHDVGAASGLP